MEIGAELDHLQLCSPDPEAMARFYERAYAMKASSQGAVWFCKGPNRAIALVKGHAYKLDHAAFRFGDETAWTNLRESISDAERLPAPASPLIDVPAFAVRDPENNLLVFLLRPDPVDAAATAPVPAAHCQHFALRTPDPGRMLDFYTRTLGFVLSDQVRDAEGVLRACFLRTNSLHHALALFMAPESRFDHQSFEAPDWLALRQWADHMAGLKVPMVWGVGRHGPGNDVFFMVADPDGNLAEISAEIEVCAEDRPAGLWPHEQRTLNLWGSAIMRS